MLDIEDVRRCEWISGVLHALKTLFTSGKKKNLNSLLSFSYFSACFDESTEGENIQAENLSRTK